MVSSMTSGLLGGLTGGATVAIVIKAVDQFSKPFSKASGGLAALGKGAAGVAIAFAGVTAAGVNLGKQGARVIDVQKAFNSILGVEAPRALNAAREGLRGTVDDMSIMTNANLLFQNIGTATAEQFGVMAEASRVLGRAVGIDAAQAFDRLTLGIAKGETELLDELGLKLDATVANRKYAESVGKTVSELTAQERATAALNNILPQLEERINAAGGATDSQTDKFARINAQFTNMKNELAVALLPTVSELADVFMKEVLPALKPMIPVIKDMFISILSVAREAMPILKVGLKALNPLLKFLAFTLESIVVLFTDVANGARFLGSKISSFFRGSRNIPRFQSGGMVQQTGLAVVHRGERITPNSRMGSSGGGGTFVFNIERIQGTDPQDMIEAFQRELNKQISLG